MSKRDLRGLAAKPLILCYHVVGPEETCGKFMNVEPALLKKQLGLLRRMSFKFVAARDLRGATAVGSKPAERVCCVTFDDGYDCAFEHAIPVLEEAGTTATFFVVPTFTDAELYETREGPRAIASWDRLRRAQEQGFEIGNHSLNHRKLGDLSLNEQIAEISGAHEALTAHGLESETFCFPNGSHNDESAEALHRAGYDNAFLLSDRKRRRYDEVQYFPRSIVWGRDTMSRFVMRFFVKPMIKSLKNRKTAEWPTWDGYTAKQGATR